MVCKSFWILQKTFSVFSRNGQIECLNGNVNSMDDLVSIMLHIGCQGHYELGLNNCAERKSICTYLWRCYSAVVSSAFLKWEADHLRYVTFKCSWVCANWVTNVKAMTVISALIIFHLSMIGFSQRHERGNLKTNVWKPSLSLTLISYG